MLLKRVDPQTGEVVAAMVAITCLAAVARFDLLEEPPPL
jgi:hypothetical protein